MPRAKPLTLTEVLCAFGETPIYEGYIRDAECFVDGCFEGERVVVNPIPSTVDTILHELIHRLRPEWSERVVVARARKFLQQMSDDDIQRVYYAYQRRKKVLKGGLDL